MSRTSLAASFAVAMSMGSPLAAAPAKPVTVVVLTRPTTVEAAAQPDAATVAEAMRYLDAVDFDGNAMRTTELVVGTSLAAMVDGLRKQFGDVPEDLISQIKTAVRDHAMKSMRETLPDSKHKTAVLYATEFTRPELIRLRELESDPVAVKARAKAREMQPRLMKIGIDAMRPGQAELDAELKRIVLDYVQSHGGAVAKTQS